MRFILLSFFLATVPLSAFAQDGYYFAAKIGAGDIDGDSRVDSDPELTFGFNTGIMFNDHLSFGLNFNFFKTNFTDTATNLEIDYKIAPMMADLAFYVDDPMKNHTFYGGLMIGVARVSLNVGTGPETTETEMAGGARIGWSFNIAHKWSIAPEFSYTHIFTDPTEIKLMTGQVLLTAWF